MNILLEKYAKKPIFGDIYNLSNLKSLLNDFINEYLTSKGMKQNYMYIDMRNTIGIASAVLGGIVVYISMYYKFEKIKTKLFLCILVYAILYLVNWVIKYFENEKFYYKDFCIKTRVDNTPVYVILVYKKNNPVPSKHSRSILDLFYENGCMNHKLFLKDLEKLFEFN